MGNEGCAINSDTASKLLHPPLATACTLEEEQHPEEELHPWKLNRFSPFKVPFLRVWDYFSGSQPDDTNRMISRAPRRRLDTFESRKNSLTVHVDHKIWRPTPYISFTTSKEAAQLLAESRSERRRCQQTLTVVNPNVRIKKGLPILDISAEMDYYEVQDPYGMSNQYYKDHFLCIWEVLEDEIVGHWKWKDLDENPQWYEEIIMPAFKAHEERMKMKSLDDEILGLSSAMSKTSRMFFTSYLKVQLI